MSDVFLPDVVERAVASAAVSCVCISVCMGVYRRSQSNHWNRDMYYV